MSNKHNQAAAAAPTPEPTKAVAAEPEASKPQAPAAAAAPTPELEPALRVVSCSPRGTFRRGGHAFGPKPTDIALSKLTDEQIKAIRNEPMLVAVDTFVAKA